MQTDVTWTLTQRMSLGQQTQAHVTWPTNAGGCYLDNYRRRMLLGQFRQADITQATVQA